MNDDRPRAGESPGRRRPTHAMVISYLAVLVALSGTANALPGKNKVRTDDIKDTHVRAADIQDGAVGSPEVGDGAVGSGELQDGAVQSGTIANGSVGGPELANGAVTAAKIPDSAVDTEELADPSVTHLEIVDQQITASKLAAPIQREVDIPVPGGTANDGDLVTRGTTAVCDPGEVALGGSVQWDAASGGAADDEELTITYMLFTGSFNPVSFSARGGNDTGAEHTLTVRVSCVQA